MPKFSPGTYIRLSGDPCAEPLLILDIEGCGTRYRVYDCDPNACDVDTLSIVNTDAFYELAPAPAPDALTIEYNPGDLVSRRAGEPGFFGANDLRIVERLEVDDLCDINTPYHGYLVYIDKRCGLVEIDSYWIETAYYFSAAAISALAPPISGSALGGIFPGVSNVVSPEEVFATTHADQMVQFETPSGTFLTVPVVGYDDKNAVIIVGVDDVKLRNAGYGIAPRHWNGTAIWTTLRPKPAYVEGFPVSALLLVGAMSQPSATYTPSPEEAFATTHADSVVKFLSSYGNPLYSTVVGYDKVTKLVVLDATSQPVAAAGYGVSPGMWSAVFQGGVLSWTTANAKPAEVTGIALSRLIVLKTLVPPGSSTTVSLAPPSNWPVGHFFHFKHPVTDVDHGSCPIVNTAAPDLARYPKTCPKCNSPAYESIISGWDCSNKNCK